MVASPALAHVVIEASDVEQLHLGNGLHAVVGQRKALGLGPVAEQPHVADHHHGVGVHRVDVEQVMLHLADNLPEFGDVASENAIAPHAGELSD